MEGDLPARTARPIARRGCVLFAGVDAGRPAASRRARWGRSIARPTSAIYLDTSFFRDLERRFRGCTGKACEFAQAYVIAHEVGHHVQNLLGILPKVQQAQQAAGSKARGQPHPGAGRVAGRLLRRRLGATTPSSAGKFLEPGDIEAALQTASAIGDDTLQQQSQGYVVPDAFTHGSSEQRKRWFMTGFKEGNVSACNTFDGGASC